MSKRLIDKDDMEKDILGDKTAYGEFISTFHHWTGLEGNHKRAGYLEQVTHERKGKNEKKIEMKEE